MHSSAAQPSQIQTSMCLSIDQACDPACFVGIDAQEVKLIETHISWIFLVGEFAYKVKKPIRNAFLDYSTIDKRRHYCEQELRLDRRFAAPLYDSVVAVRRCDDKILFGESVDPPGTIIDYAVKMRRFDQANLIGEKLRSGQLSRDRVIELANVIAACHSTAARQPLSADRRSASLAGKIRETGGINEQTPFEDAIENLTELKELLPSESETLGELEDWTRHFFEHHVILFEGRVRAGFIRECHGDLHLDNVVDYQGKLMPFDGIEFNDRFRWIDVLSDVAFTAMDFAANGRPDFCFALVNEYLDRTGDHAALPLLRWYLVYRSLVRAKVAGIRAQQQDVIGESTSEVWQDCLRHLRLAKHFTRRSEPRLIITHGVSGSGKSYASSQMTERIGGIRLRSDVERKRLFGLAPTQRPTQGDTGTIYSDLINEANYERLGRLAKRILFAGYPVIIDATFLTRIQRKMFRRLAEGERAKFEILECDAPPAVLRERVRKRQALKNDPSDATLDVLEHQIYTREPLDEDEQRYVIRLDSVLRDYPINPSITLP
ncbi:bifunctional aminoglycoside phosphotransferase/ATP-binding protein [Roseiconus lacunae]|uniref:bifunctional aminoglycoside phosphotransferase/ATP-binding protein n=2 Tax=Roseiconus lacunae TaxID=2605694 RepID=UPI00135B49A9|nr:bifunctional aminoglycoside phosphotransferase/ATP-binding protein [Roseiconus lacunae]